jgi:hypothetical protein
MANLGNVKGIPDDDRFDLLQRIEHCMGNNEECNSWEDDFLESIHEQLMRGPTRELSGPQMESLEKIEFLVEFGRDAYWEEFGDRGLHR